MLRARDVCGEIESLGFPVFFAAIRNKQAYRAETRLLRIGSFFVVQTQDSLPIEGS